MCGRVGAGSVGRVPVAQVPGGLGDERGAHRGGDEQEKGDEQFVQAQARATGAEMEQGGDEDTADPQGGGLGGAVQAGEQVGQAGQAA